MSLSINRVYELNLSQVRSAAKNCDAVAVITSPDQYAAVIAEMKANGGALSKATRRGLARAAFALTARQVDT